MDVSLPPAEGDEYTFERTFDHEDVREFGEISGDQQPIHTEPDEVGRLTVQGLLTATLPTKIGGDLNYIARGMELEFVEPVYTGERIRCTVRLESVTERDGYYDVESTAVCENEDGEDVMRAEIDGLIPKDAISADE
ncbi:MaoC family dehydratase N-terminal domain-containing protein [Natrinema zhouii]|uniref:MaoC family dehydratase N-terminal domain-containing protein n=1 Tax=Natrinema zhouii TaxID=1710539 RepID=A0A7D6CQU5_9EURY|nr:MaoC family dehydratase N-terminal domain-containing protein [Natrinema zhouii]QLK26469.1 MaoC family dehydratase N-terminal domain-containing protein [Natrinema zhouii]